MISLHLYFFCAQPVQLHRESDAYLLGAFRMNDNILEHFRWGREIETR
jgi:hypothetical protein